MKSLFALEVFANNDVKNASYNNTDISTAVESVAIVSLAPL